MMSSHLTALSLALLCLLCSVDWSPNGESVASGGKDKVLKLWRR
jgi:WD40 repeat protein